MTEIKCAAAASNIRLKGRSLDSRGVSQKGTEVGGGPFHTEVDTEDRNC